MQFLSNLLAPRAGITNLIPYLVRCHPERSDQRERSRRTCVCLCRCLCFSCCHSRRESASSSRDSANLPPTTTTKSSPRTRTVVVILSKAKDLLPPHSTMHNQSASGRARARHPSGLNIFILNHRRSSGSSLSTALENSTCLARHTRC